MPRARRAIVHAIACSAVLATSATRAADVNTLDLGLYARLLATHTRATGDVAGTRVDYAALRGDPDWQSLLASLAAAPEPSERDARLAYWINAYNILAIDVVVQHFPVASIRDVGSLLRPVWKRDAGRVGGRTLSLDEIEHGILRPLGEPRIHTAIVCASTSCPSLARDPYRSERLDAQLDAAARGFIADPRKGARASTRSLRLSPIFDWFGDDFAASGGVLAFIRRHATQELSEAMEKLGPDPALVWFDYDWSLNGIGQAPP